MKLYSKISRRQLLHASAGLSVAGIFASQPARATTSFPNKTINFLVPDSGGGSFDAYIRKFSQYLPQTLPHKVNVEPVPTPGAGGRAAAFALQNAAPDGYTIAMLNVPGIFTSQLHKKKPGAAKVDLDKLTWVANLGREGFAIAVGKNSPIRNVADMVKLSATRPVSFSSTGSGSTDNFATRVFCASLGIKRRIVTGYTGSAPTMVAVARGDVDATVHSLATLQTMARTGLIRIIFSFQPHSGLAGIDDSTSISQPSLAQIYQWRPVVAPPNTPPAVLSTLSQALIAVANLPQLQSWAKGAGTSLFPLDPAGTLNMVKSQKLMIESWKSVLMAP